MSRVRVIGLLVAVAVGAGIGGAGVARADEQSFIDTVAVLGYDNPADALSAGYAVCAMNRAVGSSLTERILRKVMGKLGDLRDADNSSPFAQAAKDHLCR